MNGASETILDRAIGWHLASQGDDMDWGEFTQWLEDDPRHRTAYEEVALSDAALDDHRTVLASFAETAGPRKVGQRPFWIGGALAASLAAVLTIPQIAAPNSQVFDSADTPRAIGLPDGSKVLLAPHSRLTVGGRHSEQLALNGGAFFAIRHDPSRQMAIDAAGLQISDIGTQFDVQTDHEAIRVEVSEGQVRLQADALGDPVRLPAGKSILFDPIHKLATVTAVSMENVGEWRAGRLTYDGAPLSLVAADLERYAGLSVTMPSSLGVRRFSGTLSIHNGNNAVRDLAQLMDLQLSRATGGYSLAERR